MSTPPNKLPQAAQDYARRGWPVVPLAGVDDGHCTCPEGAACRQPGRHPIAGEDPECATTSSGRISSWWGRHPHANIGLATGPSAGLLALLVRGEVGRQALGQFESEHGVIPRTPLARAGADGDLLYLFRHPGESIQTVFNMDGMALDVHAERGVVPLPPSLHVSGQPWQWAVTPDQVPPAPVPAWLLGMARRAAPLADGEKHHQDVDRNGAEVDAVGKTVPQASASEASTTSAPPTSSAATSYTVCGRTIHIDPEFMDLLPPHTDEERDRLEMNLLGAGRCRESLLVWKDHNILVEGHTRLPLCLQHNLPVTIEDIDLPDRVAVKRYILDLQLGRCNLTPERMSYFRGMRYELEKQAHGGDRKSASAQYEHLIGKTAEALGKKHGVPPATIRRDAEYARNVETITKNTGADSRQVLLNTKLPRQDVKALAKLDSAAQQRAVEEIKDTGTWKADKEEASPLSHDSTAAPPSAEPDDDKVEDGNSLTITKPIDDFRAVARWLLEFLGPDSCCKLVDALQQLQQERHAAKEAPRKPRVPSSGRRHGSQSAPSTSRRSSARASPAPSVVARSAPRK